MTAIIILAAGASTRMGNPKQLLYFQNRNLLQHTIEVAVETGFSPVIVVLGAKANTIKLSIQNETIVIVENEQWENGLGSSVSVGIAALMKMALVATDALLLLCDQPFITASLLTNLVTTKTITHKKIVASAYKNTVGVPVLFDASFFPHLLQLNGQEGAKKLLLQYPDDVVTVPFSKGAVDIDTKEDYDQLINT